MKSLLSQTQFIETENSDRRILWRSRTIRFLDDQMLTQTGESKIGPIYLFVALEYVESWGDDAVEQVGKYCACIAAVAPKLCEADHDAARNSCTGFTQEQWDELDPEVKAEILMDYGLSGCVYQNSGNNMRKLLADTRKAFAIMGRDEELISQLNQTMNRVGNTGWDFMSGKLGSQYYTTLL